MLILEWEDECVSSKTIQRGLGIMGYEETQK